MSAKIFKTNQRFFIPTVFYTVGFLYRWFVLNFFLVLILPFHLSACVDSGARRFQTQRIDLFDTLIVFAAYAESEEQFAYYSQTVFGRLEELHKLFDIFNAYENLNNLHTVNANAGIAPVRVDTEIIELLLAAKEAYEMTGGKTNAALGPVLAIWHEHRRAGVEAPTQAALDSAAAGRTDMSQVIIDAQNGTVFLPWEGMALDVGSIAKGFAAGLATGAAADAGLDAFLLSAGGHIVAHGTPPGHSHWNVGINNPDGGTPLDVLELTDTTVSVSGGFFRYLEVDGAVYGHIIDPATLRPAARFRQVTVVHPVSWKADALSTALFILPREEGEELAARFGAEVYYVESR